MNAMNHISLSLVSACSCGRKEIKPKCAQLRSSNLKAGLSLIVTQI